MRDISDYTRQYEKSNFENKYQVKYRRKKVLALMEQYPHDDILEIGCGLSPLALFLPNLGKCTIVEPSEEFAAHARALVQNMRGVHVVQGFFEDVAPKLADEAFDYVICSSLLHEVEEPERLLKAILTLPAVLTGHAVVHINVPNAHSFHRLLAVESGLIPDVKTFSRQNLVFQQHAVYDMELLNETIETCAKACGRSVKVLDAGSYFVKPLTHRQMQQCMECDIFDERVLDGFDRMIKYMPKLGSEIYVNFRLTPSRKEGLHEEERKEREV